ncbi:MAG: hypothetical protein ACR2O4_07270 [Hyphomicrobiaceae bacterium]
MEQLIAKVAAKVGIDEAIARDAIGIVFNLFARKGPAGKVSQLMNAVPGAAKTMSALPRGCAFRSVSRPVQSKERS